jgi:hypothetical protein
MYPLIANDIPQLSDKEWLEEEFKSNLEVLTHAEHTRACFDAVKEVYRLQQLLHRYEALYGPLHEEVV